MRAPASATVAGPFLLVILAWGSASAGDTARYSVGGLGVRGATIPPPGLYYTDDTLWYHADKQADRNGKKMDLDFEMDLLVTTPRLLYVSDAPAKAIGAHYAAYLAVPIYHSDLTIGKLRVKDDRNRVGDLLFCPLILEWQKPRFDIGFSYDLIVPTGDSERSEPATLGAEYWTHMFSVGGTGYLDKEKTWTFSLIARYEINQTRKNMNYRAGDQFHVEWGAAKFIPKYKLDVGLSGYASCQTTDDSGRGAYWDRSVRDRVFAVGPEVKWHIDPGRLGLSLRYHKEFGARDHSEGHVTLLTFNRKF